MNYFWALILSLTTVSQIASQGSTSFKKPLCLNIWDEGCEEYNKNLPDAKVILNSGFIDFNTTIAAAENLAMHGFSQASSLVTTNPYTAMRLMQDSIQDCENKFFESGIPVLFSIGKALAHSNENAREGLVKALSKIQLFSLKFIDTMRFTTSLAMQGMLYEGKAPKQLIKSITEDFKADLAVLYKQIPISLQISIKSVSETHRTSPKAEKHNIKEDECDPDTSAAISKLYKASEKAIAQGSDAAKVKKLRESLINLFFYMSKASSDFRKNFFDFKNSIHINPLLARSIFLEVSDEIHEKIQGIFTNVCLEFGVVAAELSEQEVASPFLSAEHGNDDVSYACKVGNELAVSTLKYDKEIREIVLKAAEKVNQYGIVSFYKRVVKAADELFKLL